MTANANSIEQLVIPSKTGIMKHANVSVKIILPAKKIIAGILSHACICENKYSKSAVDDSKLCVMKLYDMDITSTKKTNTIATNVSINRQSEKLSCKVDSYILHPVSEVIILLLIIAIFQYHYAKHWSKQKNIDALTIKKWRIINFKTFVLKTVTVIISMTIKLEDFDFDILIDEKSHENILLKYIWYKPLIGWQPLDVRFDKIDGFIIIYDGTGYLVLLSPEKYDSIYNRIIYFSSPLCENQIWFILFFTYRIYVDFE